MSGPQEPMPESPAASVDDRPSPRDDAPPHGRPNRLTSLVFPLLLAALGLAGALVAWRVAVATDAADGESAAGIAAARARTAAITANEARVATAMDGWLEYERARRRAEALEAAGYPQTAQRDRTEAAGNFFLIGGDAQYLDASGQFEPQRMRDSMLAQAASEDDLDPAPHFAAADAEYARVGWLVVAGVLIAAALPFLTLAEVTRGRLRGLGSLAGAGLFVAGLAIAVVRWA
jgi:hypothetical protein